MASHPLVILLAHNEAECIGSTVRELLQTVPSIDVLVVDDGSSDATASEAHAAGAFVVRHPFNLGVAAAEATGLLYAERNAHPYAVRMDGDGQHDPAFVSALLETLREGADLAVGSRFKALTSFRSSLLRRIGNRFLASLLTTLCRQRVTDPTSGFRGFGPRAIRSFSREHPHDYPEPESWLMAYRQGLRVCEVAVRMRPRRTGVSTLTPLRSALYMVKVSFALVLELARPTSRPV
jgi:glycosyltransferase involved in cell wall biosynthesis